jgi:hypothetical protein
MRLVDNPSIERLAEDFDNDVQFMNRVDKILKDVNYGVFLYDYISHLV